MNTLEVMFYGLMSTADICDRRVNTSDGRYLGRIVDVLVERETGQVRMAILKTPRSSPLGRGLFAVPWSHLQPTFGLAAFIFVDPPEELQQASELTWPPSLEEMDEVYRLPKGMGPLTPDRSTTHPHLS